MMQARRLAHLVVARVSGCDVHACATIKRHVRQVNDKMSHGAKKVVLRCVPVCTIWSIGIFIDHRTASERATYMPSK